MNTLIGNGWLHESPKNVWPRGWDVRSRSALRKCMFLPLPAELKDLVPPPNHVSPAAMRAPLPAIVPHRRNPAKDARMFPAVSAEDVYADLEAKKRALYADEKAKVLGKVSRSRGAWYEDPIALGSLLIILPPIGLAALWTSKRYSTDARWALTIMTALTLCLGAAITVVVIALRA